MEHTTSKSGTLVAGQIYSEGLGFFVNSATSRSWFYFQRKLRWIEVQEKICGEHLGAPGGLSPNGDQQGRPEARYGTSIKLEHNAVRRSDGAHSFS
jgi:hypothetical protein